jgi:hypothetical protein
MSFDDFGYATFHQPEIDPIRQKDAEIPGNLRDPHYTNRLFLVKPGAKTIYLTQGLVVTPGFDADFVDGLFYNYSDRIHSGFDRELIEAGYARASEATKGRKSAEYYEVFLRTVYEDESVNLHHILAGVNRRSGYSYQMYGTGEPAPEARAHTARMVPRMKAAPKPSWPRHWGNLPPTTEEDK